MEINDFRKNYKVNLTDEELTKVVDYFLGGKVYGVNANFGLKGMYQYRTDGTKVNAEDYVALKDELLFDRLIAKKINIFELTDPVERQKTLDSYSEEISKEISTSDGLVLSTDGLISDDTQELEHEFFINVSAENYVSVLKAIYDVIKKRELTGVRIVTPSVSKVNVGLVDSIKVLCSSEDLEYTVKALESVEDIYKKKCDNVPEIYPAVNSWYGYAQINKETKRTAVEDVSRFVLLSINEAVKEFVEANQDVTIDGTPINDYLNNTKNRFIALQRILTDNKDAILPVVIAKAKDKMSQAGINLANIYGISAIEEKLDSKYGNVSFAQEFETREAELEEIKANEAQVVSVPVSVSLPEEIIAMEAQSEANQDVVRDEQYLDGLLDQVKEDEVVSEEKAKTLTLTPGEVAPVASVIPVTPQIELPSEEVATAIEEAPVAPEVVEVPTDTEVVEENNVENVTEPSSLVEEVVEPTETPVVPVDSETPVETTTEEIVSEVTEEVVSVEVPTETPVENEIPVEETAPEVVEVPTEDIEVKEETPEVVTESAPEVAPGLVLPVFPSTNEPEEKENVEVPVEETIPETVEVPTEEEIVVSPATVEDMALAMETTTPIETPEVDTEIVVSGATTSDVLGENHEIGEPEVSAEVVEVPVDITAPVIETPVVPVAQIAIDGPIVEDDKEEIEEEAPVAEETVPVEEAPVAEVAPVATHKGVYGRDLNIVIPDFLKKYTRSGQVKEGLAEATPEITPEVTPVAEVAPVVETEPVAEVAPVVETEPIVDVAPVVETVVEDTPVSEEITPVVENVTPEVSVNAEEARLDALLANVTNPQPVVEEVAPVVDVAPEVAPVEETPVVETTPASAPVEVSPEELLTTEEVSSVVNDGISLSGADAVVKYTSIMENVSDLNLEVKGQNMTVLQFFEVNNLLNVLEPTDYVQLHPEIGGTITAKEFVSNYLVHYLTQSGEGDLTYIIGLYASATVKNVQDETEKKGFFKGLFKGKK